MEAQIIRRDAAATPTTARPEEEKLGRAFAQSAEARKRLRRLAFYALVLGPTLASVLYFGVIASGRYVSETAFVVRGVSSNRMSGLEALFRSFGIARTVDDTNIVETYLTSRDALRDLEAALPLREMYGQRGADPFSRFPRPLMGDGFEAFYDYYQSRVTVVEDTERGLAHLYVEAFRPDDAQRIAQQLIRQAEAFVNKLNDRAQNDAVRHGEEEVARAVDKVIENQKALTEFRNTAALVDPSKNSLGQVELITQLTADRDEALAQVKQAETLNPDGPQIASMRARAEALTQRIAAETARLAGKDDSLSGKVSTYERLLTLKNLSDKILAGAMLSLENARQEAARQQIYVEEVTEPNLPDTPLMPRRVRNIAQVFFVTMSLLAVAWIMTVGVREHRA